MAFHIQHPHASPLSRSWRRLPLVALLLGATSLMSGCGIMNRVGEVGTAPAMSKIENPTTQEGYTPVKMPMPALGQQGHQAGSLWQVGARTFFRDQRAAMVGDILTITVSIADSANIANETKRARTGSDTMGMSNMFGLEQQIPKFLSKSATAASLVSTSDTDNSDGNGSIQRTDKITIKLAALITQVLPNGNLVVTGKQEVRVNYELRELTIAGVIRPQDIDNTNSISYEKIAEARITYGGRGVVSDLQQPRWGQQILDLLLPF